MPVKAMRQEIAQFIAMARGMLAEGDAQRAAGIYGQVVEMAPDNAAAHAGLVRALAQRRPVRGGARGA